MGSHFVPVWNITKSKTNSIVNYTLSRVFLLFSPPLLIWKGGGVIALSNVKQILCHAKMPDFVRPQKVKLDRSVFTTIVDLLADRDVELVAR